MVRCIHCGGEVQVADPEYGASYECVPNCPTVRPGRKVVHADPED